MIPYAIDIDLSLLADSFNYLQVDPYTPGDYRYRLMSKVFIDHAGCICGHSPGNILQSSDINGHVGDIHRTYSPLSDDVIYHPKFRQMIDLFRGATGWEWDVDVHQIRILAKSKDPVPVAPEGPHSDGYKHTMPFVLGRRNVHGGIFEVYGDNKILLSTIPENIAVMFDDSKHKHYATPIELIDETELGCWDTFVITTGE